MLDLLRKDLLNARKSKDKIATSLLTTLVGESEMVGKNAGNRPSTTEEVMSTIRKFLKNAEETLARISASTHDSSIVVAEIAILKGYLPQMMSDEQLIAIIKPLKDDGKSLGDVMKFLKENHNGKYDGKKASSIYNTI